MREPRYFIKWYFLTRKLVQVWLVRLDIFAQVAYYVGEQCLDFMNLDYAYATCYCLLELEPPLALSAFRLFDRDYFWWCIGWFRDGMRCFKWCSLELERIPVLSGIQPFGCDYFWCCTTYDRFLGNMRYLWRGPARAREVWLGHFCLWLYFMMCNSHWNLYVSCAWEVFQKFVMQFICD